MHPRPHLASRSLDEALNEYRADLLYFFKSRFGPTWRSNIQRRGGTHQALDARGHAVANVTTIRTLERIAVRLGFKPYVGRVPHPFERKSREYWPRLSSTIGGGLYARGCVPSVDSICRLWMPRQVSRTYPSDVLPKSPHATSYHCNAGDGISNPMPSTFDAKQAMQAPVIVNVSRSHASGEGGQAIPPTFAHSSPRAIKSHSRSEIPIDKL